MKYTKNILDNIHDLKLRGYQYKHIAKIYGTTKAGICSAYNKYKRLGYDFKKYHKYSLGLLTNTEKQVCKLICIDGVFSYKEIADKLFIASTTASTHVRYATEKLNIHSKTELIYKYYTDEKVRGLINE